MARTLLQNALHHHMEDLHDQEQHMQFMHKCMRRWLNKMKRPTCDLLLKVSCNDRPAGCCWHCSGAALLTALQLTVPTPGPAAGSTLLTNSQALWRSNRNLTCSTPDTISCTKGEPTEKPCSDHCTIE